MNSIFTNTFRNEIIADSQAVDQKKFIEDNSKTFIFPLVVYTGFRPITTNGIQPNNARVQDYQQFAKMFAGNEGTVAIWENSLKLVKNMQRDLITPGVPGIEEVPEIKITKDNLSEWLDANGDINDETFKNGVSYLMIGDKKYTYYNSGYVNNDPNDDTGIQATILSELSGLIGNNPNYTMPTKVNGLGDENNIGLFNFDNVFVNTKSISNDFYSVKEKLKALRNGTYMGDATSADNYRLIEGNDKYVDAVSVYKDQGVTFKTLQTILNESTDNYIMVQEHVEGQEEVPPVYGEEWEPTWLDKEYSKGNYFKGNFDNSSTTLDFSTAPGSDYIGEYVQQSIVKEYTINTTQKIYDADMFKLYVIPQLADANGSSQDRGIFILYNKITYKDTNDNDVYSTLIFKSLGDAISTTGSTIRQFVQFGAPGEGYAWPKLIYDERGNAVDFEVDQDLILDRGIHTIQIEILSNSLFVNPIIKGRPMKVGQVNRVYNERYLLPYTTKYPFTSGFNKNSFPESTYYLTAVKPTLQTYYKDWREAMQSNYTDTLKKNYEGVLISDPTKTEASNPSSLGFVDIDWNFKDKSFGVIDTRASGFFKYTKPNGEQFGLDNFDPTTHITARPQDIMAINCFAYNWLQVFPFEITQSIPWGIKTIPGIGNWLDKMVLGIPLGWRSVKNLTSVNYPNFSTNSLYGFTSKAVYDFYNKAFWGTNSSNKGALPIDMFRSKTDDEVGGIFGAGAISTTYMFSLTDKVQAQLWNYDTGEQQGNNIGYYNGNTMNIGQYLGHVPEKGYEVNNIHTTLRTHPYVPLVNKDFILKPPTTAQVDDNSSCVVDFVGSDKYIIDTIGFTSLAKAPVVITMFENDPDISGDPYSQVSYQVVLKTEAAWTDRTNSIQTIYKLSYLNEFLASQEEFVYPRPISQPSPEGITNITINGSQWNNSNANYFEATTQTEQNQTLSFEFEVYDFANNGLTDLTQIKQAFKNISITNNSYVYAGVVVKRTDTGNTTDRRENMVRQSNISVDISNINTNIVEIGNWSCRSIDVNAGGGNKVYCENKQTWRMRFVGTKLMLSYSNYYEAKNYNSGLLNTAGYGFSDIDLGDILITTSSDS